MITVQSEKYGVFNTKPLPVVWGIYNKYYNKHNTIMVPPPLALPSLLFHFDYHFAHRFSSMDRLGKTSTPSFHSILTPDAHLPSLL